MSEKQKQTLCKMHHNIKFDRKFVISIESLKLWSALKIIFKLLIHEYANWDSDGEVSRNQTWD